MYFLPGQKKVEKSIMAPSVANIKKKKSKTNIKFRNKKILKKI